MPCRLGRSGHSPASLAPSRGGRVYQTLKDCPVTTIFVHVSLDSLWFSNFWLKRGNGCFKDHDVLTVCRGKYPKKLDSSLYNYVIKEVLTELDKLPCITVWLQHREWDCLQFHSYRGPTPSDLQLNQSWLIIVVETCWQIVKQNNNCDYAELKEN